MTASSRNYRRKEGRIQTKKIHRKIRLRSKHILMSFVFLTGLFFAIQQAYLFAISWDKLEIKEVTLSCENQEIRKNIQNEIKGTHLGNILLIDIKDIQKKFEAHPRVKTVHIRKLFPSSIQIVVEERQPFAVLQKEGQHLIDNEGTIVDSSEATHRHLPLLIDHNNFKNYYRDKIRMAWECLESLDPEERETIAVMDLTEFMNIKIQKRDSLTWLILGKNRYGEKLQRFREARANLETYGTLEYVDLRFQDRYFIKTFKELEHSRKSRLTTEKEAN
ncbi:MAG: FtsQ-type POTRA domain-containing protein [Candidatus Aminicenantes bacterium]|jgi:cell division septal protein FtsQ